MTTPPYHVPGKDKKNFIKMNDVHWSMFDYLLIKYNFRLEPV